jgi:hypothetical protein
MTTQAGETKDKDKLSIAGIWLNRVVLLFVSVLFAIIGFGNIFNPIENVALSNITLGSAKAISIVRVSMGAFPLGFAIIVFTSIFSVDQLFRGIFSVFVLIVVITIVRIMGYLVDGAAPFIAPEIVMTMLSGIGLYLEIRRRNLSL